MSDIVITNHGLGVEARITELGPTSFRLRVKDLDADAVVGVITTFPTLNAAKRCAFAAVDLPFVVVPAEIAEAFGMNGLDNVIVEG